MTTEFLQRVGLCYTSWDRSLLVQRLLLPWCAGNWLCSTLEPVWSHHTQSLRLQIHWCIPYMYIWC